MFFLLSDSSRLEAPLHWPHRVFLTFLQDILIFCILENLTYTTQFPSHSCSCLSDALSLLHLNEYINILFLNGISVWLAWLLRQTDFEAENPDSWDGWIDGFNLESIFVQLNTWIKEAVLLIKSKHTHRKIVNQILPFWEINCY